MLFIFMLCLCLLTHRLFISFFLFPSCTVLLICLFFLILCSHRCVLAYLMLFAALTNAVCLYNASFLPLISANAFYFHALSLFIDT